MGNRIGWSLYTLSYCRQEVGARELHIAEDSPRLDTTCVHLGFLHKDPRRLGGSLPPSLTPNALGGHICRRISSFRCLG